jgi:hypothetical protein
MTNPSPKKILLLSANPLKTSRLRLDEEIRGIKEGLRRSPDRDCFSIESAEAVRYRDIRRAILDANPNIVHFSGHGAGEEGLVFEDESGQVKFVSAEALAGLFKLFADSVECVVLNACYSQVQAEAIARHIPHVVGMNQAIGDRAAIEFAIGFYDAVGAGRDYEFAFELGCNAIDLSGIPENLTPKLYKNEKRLNSEAQETPKQPIPKAGVERLNLRRTLKSIILDQFNELIDVLDMPSGIIPPSQAEQASRVEALINWAKSPAGCGLERIQQVLEEIINPR